MFANITFAARVARIVWKKYKDVREKKAREAYASLEAAAQAVTANMRDSDLFPPSRAQAGAVTKAVHARLERAVEEFAARGAQEAKGKKTRDKKLRVCAGIAALVAGIGGAAYYVLREVFVRETPSENPPRVEEFGADTVKGSRLVYTSTSADDHEKSDLVEEGVTERDEELLRSLDEQLAKNAEEASTENAPKHRLNED